MTSGSREVPDVVERITDLGSSVTEWRESEEIFDGRLREGIQIWAAAVAATAAVSRGGTGGAVVDVLVATDTVGFKKVIEFEMAVIELEAEGYGRVQGVAAVTFEAI